MGEIPHDHDVGILGLQYDDLAAGWGRD